MLLGAGQKVKVARSSVRAYSPNHNPGSGGGPFSSKSPMIRSSRSSRTDTDLLHPQGRLYVCMYACMHAYTHTYTHTHIHTIRSPLQGRRFRRLPGRQTKLRGLLLPRGHLRMIQCERASLFREFDQCIDQTHTPHGACAFLSYCHVSTERVHELEQTLSEGGPASDELVLHTHSNIEV